MRSECKCNIDEKYGFSCESIKEQIDDTWVPSDRRFRFVKENGAITDEIQIRGETYLSGPIKGSIQDCEIKKQKPPKIK